MTRVDYCIPTINRPQALERILLSLAAHRPEASVHVADQSDPFDAAFHEELAERLRSAGLRKPPTVHRLPFDCGVSVARNHLVDSTPSEYKLVVDDDGVFTERTDVDAMVRLLDALPEAGAVAGTVTRDGEAVFFGHRLEVRGATLHQLADDGPYEVRDRVRFKRVDCLPNCALMRRELFDHVRWDPNLKTAAEHFDFYLRMKETSYTVLYAPDIIGEHPPLEVDTPYRDLRLRGEFVIQMMHKHDLTRIQMLDGTVLALAPGGELTMRRGTRNQ
jgi:GT2 family glycosyltransferase